MTLHKLPTGQYEVRYDFVDARTGMRRQGRRRFRTRYEAVQFERELMSGRAAVARDTPSLDEYGSEWLENHRILRNLSPASYHVYKVAIEFLAASITAKLPRITPRMIETAVARSDVSPVTIQTYRRVWVMLFDAAVRDGYITDNPVRAADAPRVNPSEIQPPSADDITRLLDDVRGSWAYTFFLLASTTGCRMSELLGLMWDAVDLDSGTITISRQRYTMSPKNVALFNREYVPGTRSVLSDTTKGRTARTVRLPDGVVRYLVELKKARDLSGCLSSFVVINDKGVPGRPDKLREIARAHGMRVHDLRHAHATMLIDAGIPITGVSARLGHSSPAVTVRVYAHALRKQDDAAADVAGRLFADDTKYDTSHRSTEDSKFTERSIKAR